MNLKILKWIFFITLIAFAKTSTLAQTNKPEIFLETDFMAGLGKYAPYWTISNKHGIYSTEKKLALIRAGIKTRPDTSKLISFSYGLDVINRYDSNYKIWLQEAYAEIKFSFLLLKGGLFEESYGNQDTQLSTGAYLWSGNARPMPKIILCSNDFVTVPFTYNFLEVNGGLSHGWFGEKDQYVKNTYLHQKYAYIRIGEKKLPVSINLGIHHTAMWGGTSPDSTAGTLPTDIHAYSSVFFARIGGDQGPVNEQINVLGNHLASYSLGIDLKLENFKISTYWQTMLEDKNGRIGLDRKNRADGLWGIVLSSKDSSVFLQKIVVEFFNSRNQSGDPLKSGNDNYFNNYLYKSGWTYREMTIGTPLITSPIYSNRDPSLYNYLDNNCITAINMGALSKIKDKKISLNFTYSMNYGTISIPYENMKSQLYSGIGFTYPSKKFQNLIITWQGALDVGTLLGNNVGLLIKIHKTF
jgi:hypothetical protein